VPPALDASEEGVPTALTIAFHRRAQVAVEAELDTQQGTPAFLEYTMFSSSRSLAPFDVQPIGADGYNGNLVLPSLGLGASGARLWFKEG
jgi:hypothetical protein